MSTRPTRTRKARAPAIIDESSDAEMDGVPEVEYKPTKRRAKRAKTDHPEPGASTATPPKKGRKAGKLAKLQEFPLDILFDIFGFLHASDLLKVARTTKTLRKLLMSRSARAIWIQALRAEPELPECPEGMTEPAWVKLVFESVCHSCNASGVRNVLWALRLRMCAKCLSGDHPGLITSRQIDYDLSIMGAVARSLIPSDTPYGKHRNTAFFLKKDFDDAKAMMQTLTVGTPEYSEYVAQRQKITADVREHARRCMTWQDSHQNERSNNLDAARARRKDAIKERLREIGYGKEVDWMYKVSSSSSPSYSSYGTLEYEFSNLKSVKQPKDITPRIWANIQKELIPFMNDVRGLCQVDERLHVLKARVTLLVKAINSRDPAPVYIPRVIDLYSLDAFRDILDRPTVDGEDDVTEESFADAFANFDATVDYCRNRRTTATLDLIRQERGLTADEATEAQFEVATNIIMCRQCAHTGYREPKVMSARQFLAHRCPSPPHSRFSSRVDWKIQDPVRQMEHVCMWVTGAGGIGQPVMHPQGQDRATKVVEFAGLDPKTATFDDMDAKGLWFGCSCSECTRYIISGRKLVLDWRHAVDHIRCYDLKMLGEEDSAKAEEARASQANELPPSGPLAYVEAWDCLHCTTHAFNAHDLRAHLRTQHEVIEPDCDTDFALDASDCFAAPWPPVLFETDEGAKPGFGGYVSHYDSDDDDGHFDGGIWGMFAAALTGNPLFPPFGPFGASDYDSEEDSEDF